MLGFVTESQVHNFFAARNLLFAERSRQVMGSFCLFEINLSGEDFFFLSSILFSFCAF